MVLGMERTGQYMYNPGITRRNEITKKDGGIT